MLDTDLEDKDKGRQRSALYLYNKIFNNKYKAAVQQCNLKKICAKQGCNYPDDIIIDLTK